MYCTNCGTVNPDMAHYCLKCGRPFGEAKAANDSAAPAIEIALASQAFERTASATRKTLASRLIIASLAAGLAMMVTILLAFRQGAVPTGAATSSPPPAASGAAGTAGQGQVRAAGVSPISMANDAARMANAKRIQMALATFYAENDRYPQSLGEIPAAVLGFDPDPETYRYSVTESPYGFRLEVFLNNRSGDDPNAVTENGVAKLVFVGP